jgi:thiamine biosynthesis protein ThiI
LSYAEMMADPTPPAGPSSQRKQVMIRLTGEISTKGRRTRARFQRILARNLRDACLSEGRACRIRDEWSRLYLESGTGDSPPLQRVFGVSSFSTLDGSCEARLSEIIRTGFRLYSQSVKGRRYAVRSRRTGTHDFTSRDVMIELGGALNEDAEVDLEDPEVSVYVEVRDEIAFFYADRVRGAGGLPLGAEGNAVALLSGGFDSAVASWMLLKRGVGLDYVFCNLGGDAYKRLVVEVAKFLADRWSYGTQPRLHVVDFETVVGQLREATRPSLHQLVLKRQMYRTGGLVAETVDADAVVTGEAVGQVSSQTLTNLRAIDDAIDLPVLRPLVGMDKEEIIARSRDIGTYAMCARVREYCSLGSGKPATAAAPELVGREDALLDPGLLAGAVAAREVLDLRSVDAAEVAGDAVFTERIPDQAVVIDTRGPKAYRQWHWPGAVHRESEELAREFGTLDREVRYVLYCSQGLKSARIAERMQAAGYEAYSFMGGETQLRRLADSITEGERGREDLE